jgi:hypothetical protein
MTELDVRALAHTREVGVYQDGGLFPVLAAAPGNVVIGALRGGAGHMGLAGRLEIVRSLDAGASWTPPAVVADSDADDRNPALGVSPAGTVVLAYHRQGSYDEAGDSRLVPRDGRTQPIEVLTTRSTDGGLTWDDPRPLGIPNLESGSAFGKIVSLRDGTLLLPIYVRDHATAIASLDDARAHGAERFGSYIVRSRDDGRTWSDPSLVAAAMDETGLIVLPDDTVLALLRGTMPPAELWSAVSDDGGRTWTDPVQVTVPEQVPADLVQLADGSILLAYGNRNAPYRIEGRVSRDGGRTWLPQLVTFSGPLYGVRAARQRTDLGYPSTVVVEHDGRRRGVTLYYVNASLPPTGAWQDEGKDGPLFSPRGYRAIAVTWDEAELLDALSA